MIHEGNPLAPLNPLASLNPRENEEPLGSVLDFIRKPWCLDATRNPTPQINSGMADQPSTRYCGRPARSLSVVFAVSMPRNL